MHCVSVVSNGHRARRANELTKQSPPPWVCTPCHPSSSVRTGLFLLPSKLWGCGRKIRCTDQEALHLLANRTFKVLKNEKFGQCAIRPQSTAFEFNVLKVPSNRDARVQCRVYPHITYEFHDDSLTEKNNTLQRKMEWKLSISTL